LPPRQDLIELLAHSDGERKHYETFRRACELQFVKNDKRLTSAQRKIQVLAALSTLRQLACDAGLVHSDFTEQSTKVSRAVELCQQLQQQGTCALVISQFTRLLTRASEALSKTGLRVAYLDGSTPVEKRGAIVEAFQNGQFDVFCISLKAGGTGLNLTRATHVLHLDPWWNPAVEEQAASRAHRIGQTQPVTTIRLVAKDTIEERILELHERKQGLADAVLLGDAGGTSLDETGLIDLFRAHRRDVG
jgi:SNF2 family DNA or RNA helicase